MEPFEMPARSEISVPNGTGPQGSAPYLPDKRRLGRRVSQRMTGSRRFFDLLGVCYPAAHAQPAFARLILALLSPHHVADDDGEPVILLQGQTLAGCIGRERDYAEGNLTGGEATGAFLTAFRDICLPAFEWTEHVAGERTRRVPLAHVRAVLNPALVSAWERERQTPAHELEERVYLDTGAAFSAVSLSRERKRGEAQLEGYAALAPTALSSRLYRLLASTPARTFDSVRRRVLDGTEAAVRLRTEAARHDAAKALRSIADDPFQHYGFSPYSVRLFPANAGVASVASPVRRALLPDCVEVDLASSQLAIAAVELGCSELLAFLADARSFWPEIVGHLGIAYDDGAKAAAKRAVYATVYGAGVERIVRDLRAEYEAETGAEMTQATAERFLSHSLISELLTARDAELDSIRERGRVVDCFGRTLVQGRMLYGDGIRRTVNGAAAAPSLLAQRAQARELWLLEPLIELAEREAAKGGTAEWRILAFQHDGASIRFKRRSSAHLRAIQDAVAARADRYGYPTRLDVKA